ncbi:MAG: hypothetical protein ACRD0Z_01145 [Acidimicrobiales bacterium]
MSAVKTERPNPIVRALTAFGRFWWDFLVGDTPELLVATLVVIAVAFSLHRVKVLGIVVTLACVVGFLSLSIWRGRKSG